MSANSISSNREQDAATEELTSYSGMIESIDDSGELDALDDAIKETNEKLYSLGDVIKGHGEDNGTFVNFGGYRFPNMLAPASMCTGEVYAVVSYDAHQQLYGNPGTSSMLFKGTVETFFGPTLTPRDAPDHTKYRAVMQRGFTPKQIESYKDTIVRPVLNRRFNELKRKGKADLVRELNIFYPYEIIGKIVGYDLKDIQFVAESMDKIWKGNVDIDIATEGGDGLRDYAAKLIAKRRAERSDDLISAMLEAEIDGEKISDFDLIGLINHTLSGGIETTYKQTGLLVYELLNNPDQMELLRNNRDLMPKAVEESLRFNGIGGIVCRNTKDDIEVCGTVIPKDSVVFTFHMAANRDPARWENSNKFDITRPIQRQMSFASGPHMCIGQHIARVMLGEYVNHFLDDLPNVRWDPDAPKPRITGWSQRASNTLPVVWDSVN